MDTIYNIKNIAYSYEKNFTLQISELSFLRGSTVALTGTTGSGKTTLLKMLAFLTYPEKGTIEYKSHVSQINNYSGKAIVFQLQNPYLLKRSVYKNALFPLKLRKLKKHECIKRIGEAFDMLQLSTEKYFNRRSCELSEGEIKRISLAIRFSMHPETLILDEPTSNIDYENNILIRDALLHYKKKYNTTIILSSHNKEWLDDVSDTVLVMSNGKIVGKSK